MHDTRMKWLNSDIDDELHQFNFRAHKLYRVRVQLPTVSLAEVWMIINH